MGEDCNVFGNEFHTEKAEYSGEFLGSSSMVGVVSLSHPASSLYVSMELTSRNLQLDGDDRGDGDFDG